MPVPSSPTGTGGVPNLLVGIDYASPVAPVAYFEFHTQLLLDGEANAAALRTLLGSERRTPELVLDHVPAGSIAQGYEDRLRRLLGVMLPPVSESPTARGTGGVPNLQVFADYGGRAGLQFWFQLHTVVFLDRQGVGAEKAAAEAAATALGKKNPSDRLTALKQAIAVHGSVTKGAPLDDLLKAAIA